MEMTIDGHVKSSERIHDQRKEDAKVVGKIRIIQEEIDREMVELKDQLNNIRQLLHRNIEESQRQGWNVKKKFKWHVMQLFVRNLRNRLKILKHKLSAWLKKEELRGVEFR
jgi:hypothetical protein